MSFETEITSRYADVRKRLWGAPPPFVRWQPEPPPEPSIPAAPAPEAPRQPALTFAHVGGRKSALRLVATPEELEFRADLCSGPSWRLLVRLVAAKHGITEHSILSQSRHAQLTAARFEALWLLWTHTGFSLKRLGYFFGRDHATVRHAIDTHQKRRSA